MQLLYTGVLLGNLSNPHHAGTAYKILAIKVAQMTPHGDFPYTDQSSDVTGWGGGVSWEDSHTTVATCVENGVEEVTSKIASYTRLAEHSRADITADEVDTG